MGSVVYDFLADSLFFHKSSIANDFKGESDSRIEKELEAYRNHCIENYKEIIEGITKRDSCLKVFSSENTTPVSLLKQTALYVDQFIIPDPLFPLTQKRSNDISVTAKYLGYGDSESVDRTAIRDAATFLKEVTPMVAGNYLKIFPLSYYFEGPKEIPIYLPRDNNNDILPTELLNFFWDNVSVSALKRLESGGYQIMENELYPCRGIVVDFKESNLKSSMIYHLFKTEVVESDRETRRVVIRQSMPDTPPDLEHFKTWVTQSVNSASRIFFDRVFTETLIASNLSATYLCDNVFTSKLITQSFDPTTSLQTETTNRVLNFELPFIDQIDINKLMTIRELDSNVFTNFRVELERKFRELRTVDDPKTARIMTENIFHELNNVQVEKIKQKIKSLSKQWGIDAALAIGGFAGSVQTGGVSLLATALALGKGYQNYTEYRREIRENPSYLLWRVLHKK